MQTTQELITEIQEQSGDLEGTDCWTEAFLEVWFEKTRTAVAICGCNPNGLEELNKLVEQGGRPIGVIHVESNADRTSVWCRPIAEYENEDWVAGILNPLVEKIADGLAEEDLADSGIVESN